MYSRNSRDRRNTGEYSIPPGYDGSRFRRRRRNDGSRDTVDEIILVPDSGFAPVADSPTGESTRELSVGGIPTRHGVRERRRTYTDAEDHAEPLHRHDETEEIKEIEEIEDIKEHETVEPQSHSKEKLSGILEKLGFTNGMSSDELLICAVIFLIASDVADDGRSIGDILLILALLLGIR